MLTLSVKTTGGGGRIDVRASAYLFTGGRVSTSVLMGPSGRCKRSFQPPFVVHCARIRFLNVAAARERRGTVVAGNAYSVRGVVRRRHDDLRNPFPGDDGRGRAVVLAVPAVETPGRRHHGRSGLHEGHLRPLQRPADRHGRRAAGRRLVGGVLPSVAGVNRRPQTASERPFRSNYTYIGHGDNDKRPPVLRQQIRSATICFKRKRKILIFMY